MSAACPGRCPCRPWDVAKHFWGAAIVAEGFRALYMDSDAIAKQNPLTWFGTGYDVQVGCSVGVNNHMGCMPDAPCISDCGRACMSAAWAAPGRSRWWGTLMKGMIWQRERHLLGTPPCRLMRRASATGRGLSCLRSGRCCTSPAATISSCPTEERRWVRGSDCCIEGYTRIDHGSCAQARSTMTAVAAPLPVCSARSRAWRVCCNLLRPLLGSHGCRFHAV